MVYSKNYFNLAKNISDEAIQNGDELNKVLVVLIEVCHQIFVGWEVKTM